MLVVLDSGPLGLAALRNPPVGFRDWLQRLATSSAVVVLPEIVDFELRRELLRVRSVWSLQRLDAMAAEMRYVPITTTVMRRAATLWAEARQQGRPTASPHELDVDVILAATAQVLNEEDDVIVATMNLAHLSRFVPAAHWQDITP